MSDPRFYAKYPLRTGLAKQPISMPLRPLILPYPVQTEATSLDLKIVYAVSTSKLPETRNF